MEELKLHIITLKKFGMTLGVAFLAVSGLLFLRQKPVGGLFGLLFSGVFFIMGILLPALLKPVYIIWMRFASILGWVNTRIILIILFNLFFLPLGLFMRMFKIDLLERKNKAESYWKPKEKIGFNPENYERRF